MHEEPTMDDPIVAEVHEARRKIMEQCDGDFDKLIARLRAAEAKHPERVVDTTKKNVEEPQKAT